MILSKISFNSKLVRLKGNSAVPESRHSRCFNSKLVRLKDNADAKLVDTDLSVSIPNWFD